MLQFERFGQLIALSTAKKGSNIIAILKVTEREMDIRFSEYVKSQVHLNLVANFGGPTLSEYVYALRYLEGHNSKKCYKILKRFYQDMALFLINNPENIKMSLDVDVDLDKPKKIIQISTVKEEILSMMTSSSLENVEYSELVDFVNGIDDVRAKLDSYAVAAVLLKQLHLKDKEQEVLKIVR